MLKKGILFQGLESGEKEEAGDITYLFLYGICKNMLCRAKIRDMKKEWREYLLEKADKSRYQSRAFWESLGREEKRCARIVLGLLEDLRAREDVRGERAWVCLRYLVHSGYRSEEACLSRATRLSLSDIWKMAEQETGGELLQAGRVCMCLLMAEERHAELVRDRAFDRLLSVTSSTNAMWKSENHRRKDERESEDKEPQRGGAFLCVGFLFPRLSRLTDCRKKEIKILT